MLNVIVFNLVIVAEVGAMVFCAMLAFANQWGWRIIGWAGLLGLLNLMAWMQANNHAGARAVLAFLTEWAR